MNPDGKERHADIRLSDEALDWIVRLSSGRATDEDHEAFAAWRRRSDGHERAAQEAETIWNGIGIAGKVVRQAEGKDAREKFTRRAVLGWGAAAVTGVALYGSGALDPHLFADHVTAIAEQRSIDMPDGSVAFLNAGSALSVDLRADVRRLRLFRGQATFTVAHDAARPFIVDADGGHARAIGTVFDVDVRPREVVVTVLEGKVGITTNEGAGQPVLAGMNQRVRYHAGSRPSGAEAVDAESETAWRRGKLIFNRRPLGDVVAEIERYRDDMIVIASAGLRTLEVTGVFDLADPEAILDAMEETLPVQVTRLPFVTIIR